MFEDLTISLFWGNMIYTEGCRKALNSGDKDASKLDTKVFQ